MLKEKTPMKRAILYIHGQGGSAEEAAHYIPLFPGDSVIGFDYRADTPWDAEKEFADFLKTELSRFDAVTVIANSIGAFFAMCALQKLPIEKAFFISPIVDMEKLILDMMGWAGVTERELREKGQIETDFGQTLSWDYLSYVRQHPICWQVPTHILYADGDNLTDSETAAAFANGCGATLTVMAGGEHWFHTPEQMKFLDDWICRFSR